MKLWQKNLVKLVTPLLKRLEPVHGIEHAKRVFKYCSIFAKDYQGVDVEALFAAAWLHDLGHIKLKNGMGSHNHLSADLAVPILKKIGTPERKHGLIKQIIRMHDERRDLSKKKLPIEVFIFSDADAADSVGAMGLVRQFAYPGGVGKRIWNPKIKRRPSLPYGGNFSAVHTILDHQLIFKFYTKRGKIIAKERKKYMQPFIKRFFQEWEFKK